MIHKKYIITAAVVFVISLAVLAIINQYMSIREEQVKPMWLFVLAAGLSVIHYLMTRWNINRRRKKFNKKFNRFL